MEEIILARKEFKWFRDVQIKPRWDWPATFSCNKDRDVWSPPGYGYTPPEGRIPLEKSKYPVLHKIVESFVV